MIKTFEEAVEKLFKIEIIKDYTLENIKLWAKLLWNPQDDFKIIHVAWTNWKGSVSKMVFSILKYSGKKVWVFTSPHLKTIRERFETNEWMISEEDFVEIVNKISELKIDFSYFEQCVLIAFLYFKKRDCEYVILEVWFWWLLDSTNIVNPIITTITSIWYDHTDILWKTLEEISAQKAWIIKENTPIVINHNNKIIEKIAREKNAPLIFTDKKIKTNLLWKFQENNAALAYEMAKYLGIKENLILEWLQRVKHRWRLEYISDNVLVDWSHNIDSLKELKKYIDIIWIKFDNIYYCIWLKKWKKIDLIFDIFWKKSNYIWVDFSSVMLENIRNFDELKVIKTKDEIIEESKQNRWNLYVVFGSLYMIGEFL